MEQEIITEFMNKQMKLAEAVIQEHLDEYHGKIGRELTNEETFAIAIMSGVRIDHAKLINQSDKYVANMTTIPCAVAWDGRRFLVGTMARPVVSES